jgi:hypothetical protein
VCLSFFLSTSKDETKKKGRREDDQSVFRPNPLGQNPFAKPKRGKKKDLAADIHRSKARR